MGEKTTNEKVLFLRSLDGICPDIPLERNKCISLGRSPLTGIKDPKLSREQIKVSWDDTGTFIQRTGENFSYLNLRPLKKDEKVEIEANHHIIHLAGNKYPFKLILKTDFGTQPVKRTADTDGKSAKRKVDYNHWSYGLLASMNDPELKVEETASLVVIRDKYPKARQHYLILPKERIPALSNLTGNHAPLLQEMTKHGRSIVAEHPSVEFRLGFHAVPSMSQLHLHVISQDFDSPCLKTKRHWNTFNTPYFVHPEEVIHRLQSRGSFNPPTPEQAKDWLDQPLKCHKCDERPKNIPDLKKHLLIHIK